MVYQSYSLNGAWKMAYQADAYLGEENPWKSGCLIPNAVPGYWEDMKEAFQLAPFFCKLMVNPEYGVQSYPIAGTAPDMALPNVVGNFFYQKTINCEDVNGSIYIHFEGVQNAASVWVNDVYLGRHEGYSTPFDMQIPQGVLKNGENSIVISVSNHRLLGYDNQPISGLTSRAACECTGGITGDVELRVYHCGLRDAAVIISKDCKTARVDVETVSDVKFTWSVYDEDQCIKSGEADGNFSFDTEGMETWSPESPKLYRLELNCEGNILARNFGVRRILSKGKTFYLNGYPYFLRGVCEHCYYPETVHPNHDLSFYRHVVRTLKELGFNFIRFHTYIPAEEYMQAADELGMVMHVETPNNTTYEEFLQVVKFCRRHTSVIIYCGGNELQLYDHFIAHHERCAEYVHENTDSMFVPMSALRGLDYCFTLEPDLPMEELKQEPFEHHPRRISWVCDFSDLLTSGGYGALSYFCVDANPEVIDNWNYTVYSRRPQVIHEICIQGSYTDLSLKYRYENTRVGACDMFDSIERHLRDKGVLHKAPLYFKNSSEWMRRMRKHNFEVLRRCETASGYDFLGPIDTHWHTFGYDVGMMNEFYELKPGETVRNVRMYNSETILMNDLLTDNNFYAGELMEIQLETSHYGKKPLIDAQLNIRLTADDKLVHQEKHTIALIENGKITKLNKLSVQLPDWKKPVAMKLYVTLECGDTYAENEWEVYAFPKVEEADHGDLIVTEDMTKEQLLEWMEQGKDVLLLGTGPFAAQLTTYQVALAGRTAGIQATVIYDHPLLKDLPHDGFCGWQFRRLMENGTAVRFDSKEVPFDPIIEMVSTHKFVIPMSALFEFNILNGRLLVCSFNFNCNSTYHINKDRGREPRIFLNFDQPDSASLWLKNRLIRYAQSDEFCPKHTLDRNQVEIMCNQDVMYAADNTNISLNPNDKTAIRKK